MLPAKDETLEVIIHDMHGSFANLPTQPSASGDFGSLIIRSKAVGQDILDILEKSEIERAQSLRGSIKVALKTMWTRDKIAKLRSELDSVLSHLSLHLQVPLGKHLPRCTAFVRNLMRLMLSADPRSALNLTPF